MADRLFPNNPHQRPFNQPRGHMVKCGYCGGRGKHQEMGVENCKSCGGSGRDFKEDLWAGYCRDCGGPPGKKTYCRWVNCTTCHGSGYVYVM